MNNTETIGAFRRPDYRFSANEIRAFKIKTNSLLDCIGSCIIVSETMHIIAKVRAPSLNYVTTDFSVLSEFSENGRIRCNISRNQRHYAYSIENTLRSAIKTEELIAGKLQIDVEVLKVDGSALSWITNACMIACAVAEIPMDSVLISNEILIKESKDESKQYLYDPCEEEEQSASSEGKNSEKSKTISCSVIYPAEIFTHRRKSIGSTALESQTKITELAVHGSVDQNELETDITPKLLECSHKLVSKIIEQL